MRSDYAADRYAEVAHDAPSVRAASAISTANPSLFPDSDKERILDLVTSVLTKVRRRGETREATTILLETLSGGRSGAHVVKATSFDADGLACDPSPTVVKLARRDAGMAERSNYERFVRPLPDRCRPDLLAFATDRDHAALCYSFLGDSERPVSLTDRLAQGDLAALDMVLPALLRDLRQCWAGKGQRVRAPDIGQYYLKRYFDGHGSLASAEQRLVAHASHCFGAIERGPGLAVGGLSFPSPGDLMIAPRHGGEHGACILHGDLNSDNVILDRRRGVAQLIDFQKTGLGHVYQDLATLEASLRINCPPDAPINHVLDIERLIASGDPRAHDCAYAKGIADIRQLARQLYGAGEREAHYHFALCAIGLRLMRATDLSETAHARITAGTLWAARKYLDDDGTA